MNNQCHQYIIADSQNQPLAQGLLVSAPGDPVWLVRVAEEDLCWLRDLEFVQLISSNKSLPPMSGQILSHEESNVLRIQPVSQLDERARVNLRVPVRFRSYVYPISGSWQGRRTFTCFDLSCGGIAFFCKPALDVGETAEVVIPITAQPLLLQIQVLRIRPSDGPAPLIAARFLNMIHDQEVLVREAVFSQQIQNRGRRG